MNKLFIMPKEEDLYTIESSLIDSYLTETVSNGYMVSQVAGSSAVDAYNEKLTKLSKQISKIIIGLVAIIAIGTAIKKAHDNVKRSGSKGQEGPSVSNLSRHAKMQIKKKSEDIEDIAGIDTYLDALAASAKNLKDTKNDIDATLREMKKNRKDREEIIKKYGADSPECKKKLKEMDKEIERAYKDGEKAIKQAESVYRGHESQFGTLVACGSEAQIKKFKAITSGMFS